jgi:hypothetical protein
MGRGSGLVATAAGGGLAVAGVFIAGAGLWARRESRRTLARERIVLNGDNGASTPVASARAARALALTIREGTLQAAGGRTYAETNEYLAPDRSTTSDAATALEDERTGLPVRNPDADLWIRSTALQTALTQAYMAFRIADLMVGVGFALTAAGVGVAAAARS